MHAISVKELRQKFPVIRSELKKGETFLIIYKSKPIAVLKPMESKNGNSKTEEFGEEIRIWEKAAIEDLNKHLGDDYLTEEEVKYYLSLPPLK